GKRVTAEVSAIVSGGKAPAGPAAVLPRGDSIDLVARRNSAVDGARPHPRFFWPKGDESGQFGGARALLGALGHAFLCALIHFPRRRLRLSVWHAPPHPG